MAVPIKLSYNATGRINNFNEAALRQLNILQVMRGVAAVMVVFFHAHVYILPNKIAPHEQLFRGFNMGYAGVEIFFVISGFIMWHIHRSDIGKPRYAGEYIYKRAVRIYPAYLVVLLSLVVLYFLIPHTGPENARNVPEIILSATLLPIPFTPVLEPAWTLQYELFFYALFAILIVNKTAGRVTLGLWCFGCVLNLFLNTQSFPIAFIFSAYNLLFLFGIATAMIVNEERIRFPVLLAAVGLCIYLAVGMSEVYGLVAWYKPLRTISYGMGAALMLMSLKLEAQKPLRTPKLALVLGNASYSIYLVHMPCMLILAELLHKAGLVKIAPPGVMCLILIAAAVSCSILFYVLIEKNLARLFKCIGQGFFSRSYAATKV